MTATVLLNFSFFLRNKTIGRPIKEHTIAMVM